MSEVENKNRELITRVKEKSEDDFEKNITYISAGTLVLSMTFIEKIVTIKNSKLIWALIASWILLALTLLLNLISHQISSYYHDKSLEEYDKSDAKLEVNIKRRNQKIRNLNTTTIGLLIIGIFCLILYCSKNAIKMTSKDENNLGSQNLNQVGSNDLIKGRTINMPIQTTSSVVQPSSPSTTNSGSTSIVTSNSSDTTKK